MKINWWKVGRSHRQIGMLNSWPLFLCLYLHVCHVIILSDPSICLGKCNLNQMRRKDFRFCLRYRGRRHSGTHLQDVNRLCDGEWPIANTSYETLSRGIYYGAVSELAWQGIPFSRRMSLVHFLWTLRNTVSEWNVYVEKVFPCLSLVIIITGYITQNLDTKQCWLNQYI